MRASSGFIARRASRISRWLARTSASRGVETAAVKGEANDPVLHAAFTAPAPWLIGMTELQLKGTRAVWARRHHGEDNARLRRRQLAIEAVTRAAKLAEQFVGGLTNETLIKQAEESERIAQEVMRKVRVN